MTWLAVRNLIDDPCLWKLASTAGVSGTCAIGHLVVLWHWALEWASDGDLSGLTAADIARAARWEGDPDALLQGLQEGGWLVDGKLQRWDEVAGYVLASRERIRRFRSRQADHVTLQQRYSNVTDTLQQRSGDVTDALQKRNRNDLHNTTQHNSTVHNSNNPPYSPPLTGGDELSLDVEDLFDSGEMPGNGEAGTAAAAAATGGTGAAGNGEVSIGVPASEIYFMQTVWMGEGLGVPAGSAAAKHGRALADLVKAGVTPEGLRQLIRRYRELWPELPLNGAWVLVKNLPTLQATRAGPQRTTRQEHLTKHYDWLPYRLVDDNTAVLPDGRLCRMDWSEYDRWGILLYEIGDGVVEVCEWNERRGWLRRGSGPRSQVRQILKRASAGSGSAGPDWSALNAVAGAS